MRNWRLLMGVVAVIVVTVAILAILDRLLAIYQALVPVSPWLAGLVILLLAGGASLAVWAVGRYLGKTHKTKSPPSKPSVSPRSDRAVHQSLSALQQQLQQIEDEITRQALASQAQRLQQELDDRPLRVVLFGVGSGGKTSLVNALHQYCGSDLKGAVSAAMGTTSAPTTYPPITIPHLSCPIELVDCPGTLEVHGTERETKAREVAVTADLLLFVIAEDLYQSELLILQNLCAIGKRVLLVFNKIDRYLPSDLDTILIKLRQQLSPLIAPGDIVPVSASPPSVPLPSGEMVQPSPRLQPLLDRLVSILSQEKQTLIADNILLQSQNLQEQVQATIDQQRHAQVEQIIDKYQWWVIGAVFAVPVPLLDLLAVAAIHTQMVIEIGQVYGCDLDQEAGKALAGALTRTLISQGIVKGVSRMMTNLIRITVVGTIVRAVVQSISGAYLTRIAGASCREYFRRNQDWGDGGINGVVAQQFQLYQKREFIDKFINSALQKITWEK
jgi:uncharacterized protein (DUF697 family)/GTP-binding protein EngB required for normal cell division